MNDESSSSSTGSTSRSGRSGVLAAILAGLFVVLLFGTLIAGTGLDRRPEILLLFTQAGTWLAALVLAALSILVLGLLVFSAATGRSIERLTVAAAVVVPAALGFAGQLSSWIALSFALIGVAAILGPLLVRSGR